MAIIYIIKNKQNGMCYVGQTIQPFNKRLIGHRSKRNKSYFSKSINKYGINCFQIEIINNIPEEKLDDLETHYIQKYNSLFPNGYNMETGGNKNKHLSEDVRQRISKSEKGKLVSEETRKKISKINKGRQLSDTTRQKMSETHRRLKTRPPSPRGRHPTEETRKKIRDSNLGQKRTEQSRKNMSAAHMGKTPWNAGKKGVFSEETRKKMSEAHKNISEETRKKMSESRKGKAPWNKKIKE